MRLVQNERPALGMDDSSSQEIVQPAHCDKELYTAVAEEIEKDPGGVFRALFNGRTSSYGIGRGPMAATSRRPLREADYSGHLKTDGADRATSLGLNPLRDDNTVLFAALDFDAKGLPDEEAKQVLARADSLGLPLVWARSRSNGLHGFLFLAQPTDPARVTRLLMAWGLQLGWHPKGSGESKDRGDQFFEVFPKHERLEPGQHGNWIRLPWPGGERAANRRGMWLCDGAPTFSQWLALAQRQRVTPNELERLQSRFAVSAIATAAPGSPGDTVPIDSKGKTAQAPSGSVRKKPASLDDVEQWLNELTDDRSDDYDQWLGVLMALHHEFAGTPNEPEAIALASQWSAQSGKYQEGEVEEKWRSFSVDGRRPEITIRSLRRWAQEDSEAALDDAIKELNTQYAHVMKGGDAILHTPQRGEPTFHDVRRWKDYLGNRSVVIGGKRRSLPDVWLKHPDRRSFYTVVSDPLRPSLAAVETRDGPAGHKDFNIWPGFALESSTEGSCQLFLDHLREAVCGGSEETYKWVEQWFADIVQRPADPIGTALVLRGPQGAGKSLVGEIMGRVLGSRLYTKVSRPDELTGQFNGHLQNRLLIQVEEAFWAGDRSAESPLKHMITTPMIRIERKYMDPIDTPNFGRLLITSNHSWVVPAGFGDRRFAVLDVQGSHADDRQYFKALHQQMFEQDGCARLRHHLEFEVVVDRDFIRRPPHTAALLEQQLENLDHEDRWLFDLLWSAQLPADDTGEGRTRRGTLFDAYSSALRSVGRGGRATKEKLGRHLSKRLGALVEDERPSVQGARQYVYRFASLAECRAHFAKQLALTPDWPEPNEWRGAEPLTLGSLL